MPLSPPLRLEVAKENNVEASLARTTMAPVSPLQRGTNSDRPYASAYHSPRINASRPLFVSASQRPIETVRKESDGED